MLLPLICKAFHSYTIHFEHRYKLSHLQIGKKNNNTNSTNDSQKTMLRCNSNIPPLLDPANESQPTLKFLNSLQELKELRSQIHNAADYCESAFNNAQEKKTVMDDTREYICRAVVAVVDHLGCVSANLDSTINQTNSLSEAHLRINCLKQRVVLHGEYNGSLVLSRLSRRVLPPRHFSRYISPPPISNQDKPDEQSTRQLEGCVEAENITTKKKQQQKIEEDLPLFLYTNTNTNNTISSINNNYTIPLYRCPSITDSELSTLQTLTSVLPVRDGLSNPQETKRAAFHFQMVRKHGRRILQWRIQDNDILSLIRRSKKESLKFLKF